MPHTLTWFVVAVSIPVLSHATAAADPQITITPAAETKPTTDRSFGMRIGGWGFRDPDAQSSTDRWRDCRMNGLGIFGQQQTSKHTFVEAGTDLYFSDNTVLGSVDHGTSDHPAQTMDRLSGMLTVAGGITTQPLSRVTIYTQVGVGIEWTRVTISAPHMDSDDGSAPPQASHGDPLSGTRVMPVGFFGVGGDVRVGRATHFGASFRTLLMGHFGHHEVTEVDAEVEAANQGQFYVRFDI